MDGASAFQPLAIAVERLRKDYGRLCAVDGVSFQVKRGEIYALLGPNGAGKTTTVEILEGHRTRTSGSVQVLGSDPGAGGRHFRERIGIVLQSGGLDAELTVREMVALYASFFITLVIPLLLLISLNVIHPPTAASVPGGLRYAQFLTPAVSAFCLLNACYVTTVTSMVLAREEGILKRLRGTPLPAWTYLGGRSGSALVTSLVSVAIIIATAVVFFHVTIIWRAMGYFAAAAALGMMCFFLLGVAVTMAVPKTDAALPVAYGTVLPLAFISDVFFPSEHAPHWLNDLASAFPVAPVAARWKQRSTPPPIHGRCLPPGCW